MRTFHRALAAITVAAGLLLISQSPTECVSGTPVVDRGLAKVLTSPNKTMAVTQKLVALPDMHGDVQAALRSLQLAGLIDESGSWSGGTATLVQTGDLLDRGDDSEGLVRLFMRLRTEAESAGGEVVLLMGNHELMTLQGDLRYVGQRELARLGHGNRRAGLRAWSALFAAGSELGGELRTNRPAAAVRGDGRCRSLFVHAGLHASHLSDGGVAALNSAFAAAVADGTGRLLGSNGPTWMRTFAARNFDCKDVAEVLRIAGAERIVVGHTIMDEHTVRCGGRVHLIDIGASAAYNNGVGLAAAWECIDGTISSISDGGRHFV